MRLEPLVALADVAEHAVEAVDQLADLAIVRLLDRNVVALLLARPVSWPASSVRSGRGDAALEAPRHEQSRPAARCRRRRPSKRRSRRAALRRSGRPPIRMNWPTGTPPSTIGTDTSIVPLRSMRQNETSSSPEIDTSSTSRATAPKLASMRPSAATYFRVVDIAVRAPCRAARRRRLPVLRRRRLRGGGGKHLRGRDQGLAPRIDVAEGLLPQRNGGRHEGRDRDRRRDEHHQLALKTSAPLDKVSFTT